MPPYQYLYGIDDTVLDTADLAWVPIGEPSVQAAIAADEVLPAAPPPIRYDAAVAVKQTAVTSDDQPLEVFRFPCQERRRYRADMRISGIDRGNFVSRDMEGRFVWKRITGNAVMVGITIVSSLGEAASSSWAPNAAPSGTEILFTVKGAAGRTIDWLLTGTVEVYAPSGLAETEAAG